MSFDLVFFGGTGDLTWRKLMPALFQAFRHGKLPSGGRILAVARDEQSRASKVPNGPATRNSPASPNCSTTAAWTCRSRSTTTG
jgi:glucose-6-phosphate 1-dehydrogenase